ncbi:hypothetical protein AB6A40_004517 [Gnathostoma spinigerum]|uniref:Helicase POLQ-like n=1 Tax=Gnathostoma spinigerum TaxID=75299 RepID=A0ABD6ECW2_9BILA
MKSNKEGNDHVSRGCTITEEPNLCVCSSTEASDGSIQSFNLHPHVSSANFSSPYSSTEKFVGHNNSAIFDGTNRFHSAGFPADLLQFYKEKRGITDLYDWQEDCLSDMRVLSGNNVILCLPTSAGKTLIAELLMFRETILNHKDCLFILPYVAVVQEKVGSLAIFEKDLGVCVEEYAANKGRLPPIKRRGTSSIYVATIEKANILINSLLGEKRIDRLGIVVIDELHMVGDGLRGAIIEQVIVKYMQKGSGQIVGISATLTNLHELACFLKAEVFSADFRPVTLTERVKISNTLFRVGFKGKLVPELDFGENKFASKDSDGVVLLLQGLIPDKPVLIFCHTKQACENVAKMIAKLIPTNIRNCRAAERESVVEALREEGDGRICPTLKFSILSGVAYHHSGLTAEERKHIEIAFLDGVICVLCSTSTLAAGVNLPAQRVIIKCPLIGREPLSKAQYLQMIGRAGRAGYQTNGDAVTIVHPGMEEKNFRAMLCGSIMKCQSSLGNNNVMSAFVLDLISLEIAKTHVDLKNIISSSLYGLQNSDSGGLLQSIIGAMLEKGLIFIDHNGEYSITTLGSAVFSANLPPQDAQAIGCFLLQNLGKGLVLSSRFHLIYLIVPSDMYTDISWSLFYDEYRKLAQGERLLVESLGFDEKNLIQFLVNKPKMESGSIGIRIYVTFMLQRIWNQESLWNISEQFKVTRGWLQSLLQSACSQAGSIARFSENIPALWPLKNLLPDLVHRLRECSQPELIPLLAIDGVKQTRARQLYDKGFKTVGAIAAVDPNVLVSSVQCLRRRQAIYIINSAKALVRDRWAEKMEELAEMGVTDSQILSNLTGSSR